MKFCGVGTVFTTLEYRQGKQQKIVKPHSSTAEALFSVEYPHCLSSLILKKKYGFNCENYRQTSYKSLQDWSKIQLCGPKHCYRNQSLSWAPCDLCFNLSSHVFLGYLKFLKRYFLLSFENLLSLCYPNLSTKSLPWTLDSIHIFYMYDIYIYICIYLASFGHTWNFLFITM